MDEIPQEPHTLVLEGGVAQPVAELEQRRLVGEQVAPPSRGLVRVVGRDLPHRAREGDRQLARRVDVTEQDLRESGAALLAKVPTLQDCRHLGHQRPNRQRSAVEQHDHHGLAKGHNLVHQLRLAAQEFQAVPIAEVAGPPALTAGGLVAPQHQDGDVRLACSSNRRLDARGVLGRLAELDGVYEPVGPGLGDPAPLGVEHLDPIAGPGLQPVADACQHGHGPARPGMVGVATEHDPIGVGADHRNGPQPLRVQGQHTPLVAEQHHRLPCRLQRQRTVGLAVDDRLGLRLVGKRPVKAACLELGRQDPAHRAVDAPHGHPPGPDGSDQVVVALGIRELDVDADAESFQARRLVVSDHVVQGLQLFYAVVVAHHEPRKPPLAPQYVHHQLLAGMHRDTVHLVVRGHDAAHAGLPHRRLEGR